MSYVVSIDIFSRLDSCRPPQLFQQQTIHCLWIVKIQMMSPILDYMQSPSRFPRPTHVFDSVASTIHIHPVVVSINECDWDFEGCNSVDEWHSSICTWREKMR